MECNRLVYYSQRADQAYWDDHWESTVSVDQYREAEKGSLGGLEDPFFRYLPKDGKILEAIDQGKISSRHIEKSYKKISQIKTKKLC